MHPQYSHAVTPLRICLEIQSDHIYQNYCTKEYYFSTLEDDDCNLSSTRPFNGRINLKCIPPHALYTLCVKLHTLSEKNHYIFRVKSTETIFSNAYGI